MYVAHYQIIFISQLYLSTIIKIATDDNRFYNNEIAAIGNKSTGRL